MRGHDGTWLRGVPALAMSVAGLVLLPRIASATGSESDGVYGRLDGDISLSPSIGVEQYRGHTEPALGFRTMYVSTLGLALSHADTRFTLGADSVERSVTAVQFELCPLFLGRWSQALEAGPPLLDLTLDSFTIGLGAFWDYDHKRGALRRGTSVSTGISLPLLARMSGPWFNAMLGLRLADGPAFSARTDAVAGASISWTWLVDSSIHDDEP